MERGIEAEVAVSGLVAFLVRLPLPLPLPVPWQRPQPMRRPRTLVTHHTAPLPLPLILPLILPGAAAVAVAIVAVTSRAVGVGVGVGARGVERVGGGGLVVGGRLPGGRDLHGGLAIGLPTHLDRIGGQGRVDDMEVWWGNARGMKVRVASM